MGDYRNRGGDFGGRGGRGGGRGGRDGGGRGRGGRGGRGFGRGGGHNRRRSRDLRDASISGNQRERIAVESGNLVLIDQFMLANPQFIEKMTQNPDADMAERNEYIKKFGGATVALEPGTYRIDRDPFAYTIVIHPEELEFDLQELKQRAGDCLGKVFIDTRCIAMFDRELLDDADLLHKYQDLWFKEEEKACRDLLRDNGGAVRYGFQRYGEELSVHVLTEENIVCVWPAADAKQAAA